MHLLLLPESEETDTRDLDDLEADTGNITLCLTATTEARDQDLVVLVDEVQAAVILPPQSIFLLPLMRLVRLGNRYCWKGFVKAIARRMSEKLSFLRIMLILRTRRENG